MRTRNYMHQILKHSIIWTENMLVYDRRKKASSYRTIPSVNAACNEQRGRQPSQARSSYSTPNAIDEGRPAEHRTFKKPSHWEFPERGLGLHYLPNFRSLNSSWGPTFSRGLTGLTSASLVACENQKLFQSLASSPLHRAPSLFRILGFTRKGHTSWPPPFSAVPTSLLLQPSLPGFGGQGLQVLHLCL